MLKIIITGPESCGKTTLARQLSAHFQIPLVEEYARTFFEKKQTPQYEEADLLKIAIGQLAAENQAEIALFEQLQSKKASNFPQLMICDTDLLTIKIWSEEKYGRCDEQIIEWMSNARSHYEVKNNQISEIKSDQTPSVIPHTSHLTLHTLHFLCSPEGIAWEADPLRENAADRDRLFTLYEKNIGLHKKSYVILRGSIEARFKTAARLIERVNKLTEIKF